MSSQTAPVTDKDIERMFGGGASPQAAVTDADIEKMFGAPGPRSGLEDREIGRQLRSEREAENAPRGRLAPPSTAAIQQAKMDELSRSVKERRLVKARDEEQGFFADPVKQIAESLVGPGRELVKAEAATPGGGVLHAYKSGGLSKAIIDTSMGALTALPTLVTTPFGRKGQEIINAPFHALREGLHATPKGTEGFSEEFRRGLDPNRVLIPGTQDVASAVGAPDLAPVLDLAALAGGMKVAKAGVGAARTGLEYARGVKPDAALLDAIQRQREATTIEPSLANAPNSPNARLVRARQPFEGVRTEVPPAGALPAPETSLAPYRGGEGVRVPPPVRGPNGELIPAAPPPVEPTAELPAPPVPKALPEYVPTPGVMMTPTVATAQAPQPIRAKMPMTPSVPAGATETVAARGEPVAKPAAPPPTTPLRTEEGVPTARLGGKGAKTVETTPGRGQRYSDAQIEELFSTPEPVKQGMPVEPAPSPAKAESAPPTPAPSTESQPSQAQTRQPDVNLTPVRDENSRVLATNEPEVAKTPAPVNPVVNHNRVAVEPAEPEVVNPASTLTEPPAPAGEQPRAQASNGEQAPPIVAEETPVEGPPAADNPGLFRAGKPLRQRSRPGGKESGAVPVVDYLKAAEGWIEAVEKPYKGVVAKAGQALKQALPRVADVAVRAYQGLLRSPERAISQEFENVVNEGRKSERGLQRDAQKVVAEFEKATKGLTDEQKLEVGRSLSSESSDLSTLAPEQRAAVEQVRAAIQGLREREVGAGTLSPEAQGEYPEGHLKRVQKPGNIVERALGRRGGVRVAPYRTAQDMYAARIDIPAEEARALVPDGAPLRYLKQDGRETLLKFTDSPEGMAARDAFVEAAKAKFAAARSRLGADATREIEAGDVQQAKMMMRAQADVPRAADLGIETKDPIPADVADRIFEQNPATRVHVTMQESASRIGKAETLKAIADLVDEKGAATIEPDNVALAAKGVERPPEGYEFVSNPNVGPLAGKFVRSDVAEYVRGAFEPKNQSFIRDMGDGLMERFKVARLLYNPRQWFRQVPSNMEFENLMGISNWGPRYLYWKGKGLAALREGSQYYKDLVANGFTDPAYVSQAEIGLAQSYLEQGASPGKRLGRALGSLGMTEIAPETLRRAETRLGRAYGAADAWTKATGYVYAIEELGMTPEQAAAYVRRWTPSPESVSSVVKAYSKSLLGDPWARYRAEQVRINSQALAEKPVRFTMNRFQKNLIRGAVVAAGASALSKDEEKALENEQGQGALAVGRNKKGEPLAIDYSFLSTLTDLFDTPADVGKSGEHLRDRILQITGAGDNPIYSTAAQAMTGRNIRTGRPLNLEGTKKGFVTETGKVFLQQWIPSFATNHLDKLRAAWKGEPYSPNQPAQTKSQAVLDVFFGFKLSPLDADQALDKIARQGVRAIDDLRSKFRAEESRGETVDEDRADELADMIQADYDAREEPLLRIKANQPAGAGK